MRQIEMARLSRQCQAIDQRLQAGPATNRELSAISLKYTSRISDLRDKGWDVRVVSRRHDTGLTVYQIFQVQEPQQAALFEESVW